MVGKGMMLGLASGFTVLGIMIGYSFYTEANRDSWSDLVVLLVPFFFVIVCVAVFLLFLREAGIKVSTD